MIKYNNNNKNRWVNLDNLPKTNFGNKIYIQWENSIGCFIPFQYDEVCGEIHIVGHKFEQSGNSKKRSYISITIDKYISKPIDVRTDFITNCQLHNLVKNRIADVAPHLIQYLEDPDDAYRYSYQSNEKIWMKCPICKCRHLKYISNVYRYGFMCPCTCDGISAPNKIMFEVLKQLNVEFISEVNKSHGFLWMENYLYDFYFKLNNESILIEMDGFFHQFQQDRDTIKTELATNNGFRLIRIDCIYKNVDVVDFIKEKILHSELAQIITLDNIDWMKCKEAVVTSLVERACCLWENNNFGVSAIADILDLDRHTICKYLQKGKQIGICKSYNETEARRRGCVGRTVYEEYKQYKIIEQNNVVV